MHYLLTLSSSEEAEPEEEEEEEEMEEVTVNFVLLNNSWVLFKSTWFGGELFWFISPEKVRFFWCPTIKRPQNFNFALLKFIIFTIQV